MLLKVFLASFFDVEPLDWSCCLQVPKLNSWLTSTSSPEFPGSECAIGSFIYFYNDFQKIELSYSNKFDANRSQERKFWLCYSYRCIIDNSAITTKTEGNLVWKCKFCNWNPTLEVWRYLTLLDIITRLHCLQWCNSGILLISCVGSLHCYLNGPWFQAINVLIVLVLINIEKFFNIYGRSINLN